MSGAVTPGLVCAHHHIYSTLARGMPPPPKIPMTFGEILEQIWWRLDTALDLDMIEWSARLAALEALEAGTTTIIDHHESPGAIEGSLSVLVDAAAEVGVRVLPAYGVTDRHGADGARRGIEENRRFFAAGGRGWVGLHAAFTCSDDTIEAAAALADEMSVGVHVHVHEGIEDGDAADRLGRHSRDNWLLAHCVHLPTGHTMRGTVIHNPASNLNNAVGYADPRRFANGVALGTDGIGADMLGIFRLAYYLHRSVDVTASPETAWAWLETSWNLAPEARLDRVLWSYEPMEPWHLAFTPVARPIEIEVDGTIVWNDGGPTRVDPVEIRAKAAEQASRLHARL
jgi:cytosine/adenosine deaminase-related metal-dependent hydrolase